jgi:hypothetical protein
MIVLADVTEQCEYQRELKKLNLYKDEVLGKIEQVLRMK